MAVLDAQVVLDGLVDAASAAQHAGRGAADHDVVLAHLAAVEHGVEGGHLRRETRSPSMLSMTEHIVQGGIKG